MTARDELLALAQKCEKAEGPDVMLNLDIHEAIHGPLGMLERAKQVSTSLDAALSLAVPGYDWDVGSSGEKFEANVTRPGLGFLSERGDAEWYGHAATAALALASAWLKARAATLATKETDHG